MRQQRASRKGYPTAGAQEPNAAGLRRLQLAQRGDNFVDCVHDLAARLDRSANEEIHAASYHVLLSTAFKSKVGRDRDDAAVTLAFASHELCEHPNLARGAVVDHGSVEPCDKRVGRAETFGIDPVDLLDRDICELGEVLVRDKAFEAFRAQPRGEQVEPRALGFGEQRAGNVKTQGAAGYRSGPEQERPARAAGGARPFADDPWRPPLP
jgi:hypothetical protein